MKKFTCILVLCCVLLMLISCDMVMQMPVPPESETESSTHWNTGDDSGTVSEYELIFDLLSDGTYGVKSVTPVTATSIEIPSSYRGIKVTQILDRAFADMEELENVAVPSSITSIGNYVFVGCTELSKVEFESRSLLESIGRCAFAYCEDLMYMEIPAGVTYIGDNAFLGCKSLSAIHYLGTVSHAKNVFDAFCGISIDRIDCSDGIYMLDVTHNDSTEPETETETGSHNDTKNPGDYQYVEKNDKIYVLSPSGALNLRDADYQKKASVATGTELQRVAVSTDGVWSKIIYAIDGESFELYVNNKYITLLADFDAGFEAVEKTLIVKAAGIRIHIAPEADEKWQEDVKIIGWYTAGDEVKVLAENTTTGYYKVEFTAYGGVSQIGYILNNPEYFE